ncbi:MAG TPA: hypothetical protein VH496_03065 [Mycobacterium sp.]
MAEPSSVVPAKPVAEAIGTTGLMLNMVAVIAFALCVASLGTGTTAFAVGAGAVALISFAASLVILMLDGKRSDDSDSNDGWDTLASTLAS